MKQILVLLICVVVVACSKDKKQPSSGDATIELNDTMERDAYPAACGWVQTVFSDDKFHSRSSSYSLVSFDIKTPQSYSGKATLTADILYEGIILSSVDDNKLLCFCYSDEAYEKNAEVNFENDEYPRTPRLFSNERKYSFSIQPSPDTLQAYLASLDMQKKLCR